MISSSQTQPALAPDLVAALGGPSRDLYYEALGRVQRTRLSSDDSTRLIADVVKALNDSSGLSDRVQAERLQGLLSRLDLDERALTALAVAAREFPPSTRNTVAQFLTPHLRRQLPPFDERRVAKPASDGANQHFDLGVSATPSTPDPATSAERPPLGTGTAHAAGTFNTVVLLASPLTQDANKALLSKRGFGPLVWRSVEKLQNDLARNSDVCACIVHGSVLQGLDADGQRRLFELLGAYSTFVWIRVEDQHLQLKHEEVRACLRGARCLRGDVPAAALSIQEGGNLREREIADIEAARDALLGSNEVSFVPGEITSDQSRLLVVAAQHHYRDLRTDRIIAIDSLETRFLPGGRSSARIASIRANSSGRPLIAKIDSKDSIVEEMRRFREYIQAWDNELQPTLHFHGNAAIILFELIPSEADRERPAQVLAEQLESLWNNQLFGHGRSATLTQQRDILGQGLAHTTALLGSLNRQRAPKPPPMPGVGDPNVAFLVKLATSGLDWGLPPEARIALDKAGERFRRLAGAAVIHGDVHLRNVLLRGTDPHLIDYAGSGPGHPAVDLARFELALYLEGVRQLETESRCVEYQRALSIDGASTATLAARFPAFHSSHLNSACSQGCVAARQESLKVLESFGADLQDYLAAKYVVAWQNLLMIGRHTGLARAVVEALAPTIAAW